MNECWDQEETKGEWVNGGGVSVTKTKKRKRPSNLRLCTETCRQNQTDQKDRIGQDKVMEIGRRVDLQSQPLERRSYLLRYNWLQIRDQQMYSKMYSKEGWATRGHFEDYTPLKKLLVWAMLVRRASRSMQLQDRAVLLWKDRDKAGGAVGSEGSF